MDDNALGRWSWTFDLGDGEPARWVAREESPGGNVHLHADWGFESDLGISVRRGRAGPFDPRAAADAVEECLAFIEKMSGVPKADAMLLRMLTEEDKLDRFKALAIVDERREAIRETLVRERAKIASVREQNPPSRPSRWRVVFALLVTAFLLSMVVGYWPQVMRPPSFVAVAAMTAMTGGYAFIATLLWRWTRGKRIPAIIRHRTIAND